MTGASLPYRDRRDAGKQLAAALQKYRQAPGLLVLGLPRGGVEVAYEVALALNAPLDVLVVRKLGLPGHEEYAMGAIASGGVRFFDPPSGLAVARDALDAVIDREEKELARREMAYRGARELPVMTGRTVILVDDGLATGSTMQAAVAALRQLKPARVVVAAPVGAADTCTRLRAVADELVCPAVPEPFYAISPWYEEFPQTSDEEVQALMRDSAHRNPEPGA
ncbi:MAG: phosphoribosyltransferase family protein [Pseudomonadota bacterium]